MPFCVPANTLRHCSVRILLGCAESASSRSRAWGRRALSLATLLIASTAAACGQRSLPVPTSPNTSTTSSTVADGITIGGVYRLTFTAAASCQLPDDARHRTYTATINGATVTLADAQFWTDGYCGSMNTFDVHVQGNRVFLGDWAGDCGIIEKLASMRYLKLWGTAEGIVTDPISAVFGGSVRVVTPDGSNESTSIATCTAPDHQLVFERMASTASGAPRIRLGRERTR
jgi:hypothetical protein